MGHSWHGHADDHGRVRAAGAGHDGRTHQSGTRAAAANNRHGGRPRKVDDAAAARAKELKGKGISASDIGKMLGVSRATVYRCLI
ncbi:MAG: helix-turn-helix domain-containing protein [Arthrobacter sp.]